jgi:hypothetical protein
MGGCCVVIMAIIIPRVTLFMAWLFSDWFRVFDTWWLPFLGFLLLPRTTLVYMAQMLGGGGIATNSPVWIALFIVAIFLDFGITFGTVKIFK